jgi:hypothetical protein
MPARRFDEQALAELREAKEEWDKELSHDGMPEVRTPVLFEMACPQLCQYFT